MSRRRRGSAEESSLELLLDTICNTFGGILFLAMLVCLMVGRRSEAPPAADPGPGADPAEVARVRGELEATRTALEVRRASVRAGPGADPALVSRWVAASGTQARLRAEARELAARLEAGRRATTTAPSQSAEVVEARAARAAAAREAESAGQEAERSKGRLEAARAEAEEARRRNTVQLRMPQERVTTKAQVAWVLSGSRLYAPVIYDEDGLATGTDPRVVRGGRLEAGFGAADLVPGAGVAVTGEAEAARMVGAMTRGVDGRRRYVALLTYPDSYEAFGRVRDALTAAGFEYEVIVLPEGGTIGMGSGPRRVQ